MEQKTVRRRRKRTKNHPAEGNRRPGRRFRMWRWMPRTAPASLRGQYSAAASASLWMESGEAYIIDCRTYPARSVQEPDKDKVLRGSRDGFVETVVFNTALIRRRIRDTDLVMEMLNAGESSKTDIVLCYMEGRADPALVEKLRSRINGLEVDALTMNQESLAECIYHGKWFNPFPKFKYTERPDAAAAGILEGKVAVLVDNSPSAMLLPATLFDIMEEADDFYFPPVTGTYLKISRFLIGMLTLFLTPLWLLLMQIPSGYRRPWNLSRSGKQ